MSLEELEAEIRKLDLKDRATLAKRIVESLDDLTEKEIEALWAEEAKRRLKESISALRGAGPTAPGREMALSGWKLTWYGVAVNEPGKANRRPKGNWYGL